MLAPMITSNSDVFQSSDTSDRKMMHDFPPELSNGSNVADVIDDSSSAFDGSSQGADITTENIDSVLAKELNQLSFKERSAIYEEMHSVDSIIEETSELLQSSFEQLENELCKIRRKEAYNQAESISPEYVRSYKLRIMFLRADYFQADKAAKRLVAFFEGKLELFGPTCLARPICQSDLDKDSLKAFKSGAFQVLQKRDRRGRLVCANFHKLIPERFYKHADNMRKAFFYWLMVIVENDEETQRKGIVGIMYLISQYPMEFDFEVHTKVPKMIDWIPVRLVGFHVCSDDRYVRGFKALIMATMGRNRRVRTRLHDGTAVEVQYSMMSFGIPVDSMPLGYNGELKVTPHTKWLAKLKIREDAIQSGQKFDAVDIPGVNDVLCGRGKFFRDHSGTYQLRSIVEEYLDQYMNGTKDDRSDICKTIFDQIQELRGRFLKRLKDGWWVCVSDEAAKEKISMTFRTMISVNKKGGAAGFKASSAVHTYAETENKKRTRIVNQPEAQTCFSMCSIPNSMI